VFTKPSDDLSGTEDSHDDPIKGPAKAILERFGAELKVRGIAFVSKIADKAQAKRIVRKYGITVCEQTVTTYFDSGAWERANKAPFLHFVGQIEGLQIAELRKLYNPEICSPEICNLRDALAVWRLTLAAPASESTA